MTRALGLNKTHVFCKRQSGPCVTLHLDSPLTSEQPPPQSSSKSCCHVGTPVHRRLDHIVILHHQRNLRVTITLHTTNQLKTRDTGLSLLLAF